MFATEWAENYLVMRVFVVPLLALCVTTSCSLPKEQQPKEQAAAPPEIVNVKYRGQVNLAPFDCKRHSNRILVSTAVLW